jgi:UDP-N-acetylglucosamine acyltransferase
MARIISPLAAVDPQAKIGEDVTVGPFCVIGRNVVLGDGTRLANNVTVLGHTTLGEDNVLFPNVVIGADPQDVSYKGEPTRIEIGHHNHFREGVTVNRATTKECGLTKIGNYNYFMANCHVAHDCIVGDHVILANGALLGGHTHVHERAIISGNVGVHHWVTVGASSFVGGMSRIVHDVPPYMLVEGHPSLVRCVNIVGLKRQGFTADEIASLSESHRLIYRARMGLEHAREILKSHGHLGPQVQHLLDFIDQQRKGAHGRQRDGGRKTGSAANSTKTAA